MEFLFNIISIPLSYVLRFFALITGNSFAASVFLFTIFINVALIPLTLKSQKAAVGQARIKPKLDELKKKYGDDKQRYSQEMQKLYQQENISMSGGCLPTLIRMPFLFAVFWLINDPAKYGINNLGFSFFGINLQETPSFNIDIFHHFEPLWLIPILAFATQMLTSIISIRIQKKVNPDAPSMSGMMLVMPVISLFIGFSVPGAVGFYWACSSLVGGLIQAGAQYFYGPQKMLAAERAKDIVAVYDAEQKYINSRVADKKSDK